MYNNIFDSLRKELNQETVERLALSSASANGISLRLGGQPSVSIKHIKLKLALTWQVATKHHTKILTWSFYLMISRNFTLIFPSLIGNKVVWTKLMNVLTYCREQDPKVVFLRYDTIYLTCSFSLEKFMEFDFDWSCELFRSKKFRHRNPDRHAVIVQENQWL